VVEAEESRSYPFSWLVERVAEKREVPRVQIAFAWLIQKGRLALFAQLCDSLDDHQVQLTSAQQIELERRLTTHDHDRTQSVTWETLKAELEQRCP
jgi:putative addiction module component (TIGR02574 family)